MLVLGSSQQRRGSSATAILRDYRGFRAQGEGSVSVEALGSVKISVSWARVVVVGLTSWCWLESAWPEVQTWEAENSETAARLMSIGLHSYSALWSKPGCLGRMIGSLHHVFWLPHHTINPAVSVGTSVNPRVQRLMLHETKGLGPLTAGSTPLCLEGPRGGFPAFFRGNLSSLLAPRSHRMLHCKELRVPGDLNHGVDARVHSDVPTAGRGPHDRTGRL
jgi:hypothetical protein